MLYIPVCICLRPAHGMRLWFPSVTIKNYNKNSRGQKGVFLMTFSFIDIEQQRSGAPPPRVQCFFFSSQFKYNYSHVCEFFLKTEKLHDISLSFSVCWKSAVNFVSFFF